ncbi:MAG: Heavy metal sensor histidine kinase [uncultured Chthoniobacterales bacterium]|uniref:histidine kinase n=1 Tax=uncultured Chthoniobacterales bacterium TaxID=1836801 RepID=A0A6J4ID25_9BACT|nr:MAG: Heavy metal sensor histidine kinase [uncultured Chthoniobacterales bacterium]
MPSAPTEPRSIATQLVLLFTAAAALLLGCALGVLYWIVVQHASEEDDHALADKVFALRAHIREAGAAEGLRDELQAMHADERSAYSVRVLNPAREPVAQTPGMDELLPVSGFPAVGHGEPRDVNGRPFKLSVAQETAADGQTYTVQVAQDRSRDAEFTNRFRLLLAGVLIAGILAAAVIAVTVTKRGLRPLAAMTSSVQRIRPAHLDERVAPAGWPRELQPLAIAFDQMLDRLEDSFTRLSRFSADLAHELRTPIANIRGETEVALTRPRSPGEYQKVLESSLGECERLSAIIDSLLFLARAEAADRSIQPVRFDAREEIQKIAEFYQPIAEERAITLACNGKAQIDADPVLFRRAVSNLVENALRYTPEAGRISIGLTARDADVQVAVQDNGSGIGAEHLPRVFDRFYRADPARSPHGSGLGLALVKSIADLHSGTAEIASRVGHGTTVTLTLPVRPS